MHGTTQHRLKLLGLILFTGASEGATEGVKIRARILQDALVTPPLYTFQEMLNIPEACIILANYVISTEVLTEDTIFTSTKYWRWDCHFTCGHPSHSTVLPFTR